MILRRAMLLLVPLLLVTTAAYCADAVMGRYVPQQTGYTDEKLEPPLKLNWEYAANKYKNNPASPAVADGVCYFACGDYVYAVEMETGALKWKYPSNQGLGGSVRGTPAVSNGLVYFGAGDGNLYCISADTGTFQWAYQTRGAIRCPPVIQDDVIFFGADDNCLYTVQAASGDAGWRPWAARDDFAVGVAVGAGMVVGASMDGNVYGINAASGKPRWQFRLTSAPSNSSPVIMGNIVVMAVGNAMYGINVRGGQMRWSINLPADVAATPATDGATVYVPCKNRKIYAYNTQGRQIAMKWVEPADLSSTPTSSPTIADQTMYVTGTKGVVAAFSTIDGSLKWRYVIPPSSITTPGALSTSAHCSPVVAEGALLVLTDDGVLHCFTPGAPDSAPPEIYNQSPASGSAMSGTPPIRMSASLYDIGSGVDFSTVTMSLDGQPLNTADLEIDPAAFTVTYKTEAAAPGKPVKALPDGIHTILLTAKDYAGNLLTAEWYFAADSRLSPPKMLLTQEAPGKKQEEPARRPETPRLRGGYRGRGAAIPSPSGGDAVGMPEGAPTAPGGSGGTPYVVPGGANDMPPMPGGPGGPPPVAPGPPGDVPSPPPAPVDGPPPPVTY